MTIEYSNSIDATADLDVSGFFVGWPSAPDAATFREILKNSSCIWLATDSNSNKLVGFINAITDKTLCAYIPLLEVLPSYQNKGIGSELTRRMLDQLKDFYMVDLGCDENMKPFYERFDMTASRSMIKRNNSSQSGLTT